MKFINTCIILVLLLTLAGCQKDDNFVIKGEAFSFVISGYNGSNNGLEITIDTMTLSSLIEANREFKRTDQYVFPDGQNQIKLTVKEKETNTLVYETEVKRGEYSKTINLTYVNGQLIEKPVLPADIDGIRQVSYLFLPSTSNYSGEVDIVYFKKTEYIENNQFVLEKEEELAKVTVKPYAFSAFLQAPVFEGGRTEIDGKVYFINPSLKILKSGTNIPYYTDAGFNIEPGSSVPLPMSNKPQILGITEVGSIADKYISYFQTVQF
jgi:hypothetical protein